MGAADKAKLGTNQVMYSFELPANTDATIDVKASDAQTKLGVFAYAIPQGRYDMPSSSLNATSCKVSIKGQSGGDRVLRMKGAKEAQNVLIGIAPLNTSSTGTGSSLKNKSDVGNKSDVSGSKGDIGGTGSSAGSGDKGRDIGSGVGGTGSSSDNGAFDKGDMNRTNDLNKDRDLNGDINKNDKHGDLYNSGVDQGVGGTGTSSDNGAFDNKTGAGSSSDINAQPGAQDRGDLGSQQPLNGSQPSGSSSSSSSSSSSGKVGTGAGTGATASGDFTVTIDLH